ncbi:MAG: hypothetical protein AAF511_11915, partial [Pseudomonadota bacterium]
PDGLIDKGARFLRRHRGWSTASAVSLVAITIGALVATSIIGKQRDELSVSKANAERLAESKTLLAKKEAKSAKEARESSRNKNIHVDFISRFFESLSPIRLETALSERGVHAQFAMEELSW